MVLITIYYSNRLQESQDSAGNPAVLLPEKPKTHPPAQAAGNDQATGRYQAASR